MGNLSPVIDRPGKFLISNQDNLPAEKPTLAKPDGQLLSGVFGREISQEEAVSRGENTRIPSRIEHGVRIQQIRRSVALPLCFADAAAGSDKIRPRRFRRYRDHAGPGYRDPATSPCAHHRRLGHGYFLLEHRPRTVACC